MPEVAKEFSAEGYEAFVKYWFEAQDYALFMNEPKYLDEVSHDQCIACNNTLEYMEKTYAAERWQRGGEVDVLSFYSQMSPDAEGRYVALLEVRQDAGAVHDSDGGEHDGQGQIEFPLDFHATYEEGRGWEAVILDAGSM